MILAPLAALAAVVAPLPPPAALPPLSEAAHAIAAGRLDQARLMIANALAAGASGDTVDRLLADLAFASGDAERALAGYSALLQRHPGDVRLSERAGIAALQTGDVARAGGLLDRAISGKGASWRAWNARGIVADRQHDWASADRCYARAAALSPQSGEVANNHGWSLLLRGRWPEARSEFGRAARLDPGQRRIANNLELANAALDGRLPQRRPGEDDKDWGARLNDAGVAAALTGDRQRAIAAFAQAMMARKDWYARAANNLAAMGGGR